MSFNRHEAGVHTLVLSLLVYVALGQYLAAGFVLLLLTAFLKEMGAW